VTKTTFDEADDEDNPLDSMMSDISHRLLLISGLTAEDLSRQLLDSVSAHLTQSPEDYVKQMQVASQYVQLAQAYILGDAIKELASAITKKNEGEESGL